MFADRSNTTHGLKVMAALAGLLALALAFPCGAGAAQKKKKNAADPNANLPKRVNFDISKIVWPSPPEIARVKFVEQLTGEKIDFNRPTNKPQKPKQSWMDRLAGTKPQVDTVQDLPFQLVRTYGLAFDSKGNIYAADQAVGAIFIFNPDADKKFDVKLIRNGKESHFGLINGLAIDDNDRLFVSDDQFHKVIVINPQHQEESSFGADVLVRPGGMAIDTENRFLYVVDTESDVVDVFDADSFKLLRKIGTPGRKHVLTDAGNFSLPTNVAVDKEGNVYVTDTLNNRVEIFDADGKFISAFGKSGDGPGHFARPKGIAIDRDGHIWVVDAVQQRVQVFDTEGRLLIYFGDPGNWPGQFSAPLDIAIDAKSNRVVTSEQFPGRVQVFRYVTDAEAGAEKASREAQTDSTTAKPAAEPAQKSPEAAPHNNGASAKAQGLVAP
ncbi:MAG TPA: 6-bladed beta-propeller [Candidatus Dormibacteraeota bacterium]|nr:6-bladed beta-propeller [Candidatus Dormibacteraeota bacterium]